MGCARRVYTPNSRLKSAYHARTLPGSGGRGSGGCRTARSLRIFQKAQKQRIWPRATEDALQVYQRFQGRNAAGRSQQAPGNGGNGISVTARSAPPPPGQREDRRILPASSSEVGSTTRAITRFRNTSSPSPSALSTSANAPNNTRESVPTTRPALSQPTRSTAAASSNSFGQR